MKRDPLLWRLEMYAEQKSDPYFRAWMERNRAAGRHNSQDWDRAPLGWHVWSSLEETFGWLLRRTPHRHQIMDDQCMKPEHRFCAYCLKRFPYVEVSR